MKKSNWFIVIFSFLYSISILSMESDAKNLADLPAEMIIEIIDQAVIMAPNTLEAKLETIKNYKQINARFHQIAKVYIQSKRFKRHLSPFLNLIPYIKANNYEKVNQLLQAGANPNTKDIRNWPILIIATNQGNTKIVATLIQTGADINASTPQGKTALMIAASTNNTAIAHQLIKAGTDLNAQNSEGWTALMFAVNNGYTDMVDMLIKAGANPLIPNTNGDTTQDYARSTEIKRLLKQAEENWSEPTPR